MTNDGPTTGLALQLERVSIRPRITQRQIGEAMTPPVSGSRVAAIEREGYIAPDLAQRYLTALDTCRTSKAAA